MGQPFGPTYCAHKWGPGKWPGISLCVASKLNVLQINYLNLNLAKGPKSTGKACKCGKLFSTLMYALIGSENSSAVTKAVALRHNHYNFDYRRE